ncbi:MAG: hypothetical protein AABZ27_02550, partial [Candidatus Omnitrophota bacterium]
LKGLAISLATPDQGNDVRNIEKIIRTSIPLSKHPGVPAESFSSASKTPARTHHPHRPQRQDFRRFHRR